METGTLWFLIFGTSLVVVLAVIIIHYYRRSLKDEIEQPKYRMLDDDEDF